MNVTLNSVLQRHVLPLALLLGVVTQTNKAEPMPETVRVMSFNLWHGGDAGKQPLERTVEVIKQSQADIVGLQETAGIAPEGQPRPDRAAEIARLLGWNYVDQGERTGVISRFAIVGTTPRKWGVKLALPSGRQVYLFNVHFAHAPYQPYQLLDIPYENAPFLKTAEQAVAAAHAARGEQVRRCLAEVNSAAAEGLPMFLTGDFNEPSHRDWTLATRQQQNSARCVSNGLRPRRLRRRGLSMPFEVCIPIPSSTPAALGRRRHNSPIPRTGTTASISCSCMAPMLRSTQ